MRVTITSKQILTSRFISASSTKKFISTGHSLAPKDLISRLDSKITKLPTTLSNLTLKTNPKLLSDRKAVLRTQISAEFCLEDIKKQQEIVKIDAQLLNLVEIKERFNCLVEMFGLGRDENDLGLLNEVHNDFEVLDIELQGAYLVALMDGESDKNGCYIELRAGAGGSEACYWVSVISRMYLRWGISRNYEALLVDFKKDDIAGYNRATISIKGEYAYGYAKNEAGAHRFQRCSPFDTKSKRHTSFISVSVLPIVQEIENSEIAINPKDLKIELMKSQGAGGQHVNTTESAIRITHLPTGIVVFCQQERSQHRNRATAMEWLSAKLYAKKSKEEADVKKDNYSQLGEASFGNQIRNYSYQTIKDNRTGMVTHKVDDVFDGSGLQEFMEASLLSTSDD